MTRHLRRDGAEVGHKRFRQLMGRMGPAPIYQHPCTTVLHPEHRIYRYLLQDLVANRPNQAWCADIKHISMRRGLLYLGEVMDRATRKVLVWRVSNMMELAFFVVALQEALARSGRPEIFDTDQGSLFTLTNFTDVLRGAQLRISMDGRERWMYNVFIERLWRSLKYGYVHLHAFEIDPSCEPGWPGGAANTIPADLIRPWAGIRPTRHMGSAWRRNWRPDDN